MATSTSTSIVTTTVTTTTTGNWWDSLGTPQYGGETNIRLSADPSLWDIYVTTNGQAGYGSYLEHLFCNGYTTNPSIWNFAVNYLPPDYAGSLLAKSYEMPNPTTVVVHLNQNIYWQNIAPANGRQFLASDVVFHYDRMFGLGDGFTTPSPAYAGSAAWAPLLSVTATDKFTVTFQWKTGTCPLLILDNLVSQTPSNLVECPDAVTAYGNLNDWHHAIGTGPWILTDYVSGSSETVVKNQNYWDYDARWPQNKLPYMTKENFIVIANLSTAEAALRTGKLDSLGVSAIDAKSLMITNPHLVEVTAPTSYELSLDPRNDLAPFNNINVRIAMQEAINIPLISSTYYMGTSTPWPTSLTQNQMGAGGWGCPYPDWPASTQAEYAYNPTNAKELLTTAGYPNGFSTDLVLSSDSDQDLYTIAQSELLAINIKMSIIVMDPTSWSNYVATGRKQDALAARAQGQLGITSDPFQQLQKLTSAASTNYMMVNDPKIIDWYNKASVSTTVDQVKQILHDENLYVATQHFIISLSQPNSYYLRQPWLKGCSGPTERGSNSNACWLDLDLKKALGY